MIKNTRVWGVALIVSLMLNAFGFGLMASNWRDHRMPPSYTGPHPAPRIPPNGDPNRPQQVDVLFKKLRESGRKEFLPLIQEIHSARRAAQEALQADPFDPADLEQALASLRKAEQAAAEHAHASISQLARDLSPEQRAHLGRFIQHNSGPGRHVHPGMRPDSPRPRKPGDNAPPAPADD